MGIFSGDRIPCTSSSCTSSDGMCVYVQEDGSIDSYCFVCGHYDPSPYTLSEPHTASLTGDSLDPTLTPTSPLNTPHNALQGLSRMSIHDISSYPIRNLPDRSISADTCAHFGVRVGLSQEDGNTVTEHYYPVYKDGSLSGYKQRVVKDKKFYSIGDCKDVELFGQPAAKTGAAKRLFITEGECDAMALYQCLKTRQSAEYSDYNPAVVSLAHGSSSAVSDISTNFDFVNSYDQIVLVFDQDGPGKKAVKDVCNLLAGKVFVASLSEKDPNEMILKGKGDELKWAVLKHAKKYMPDNVVDGAEAWDRYKNGSKQKCYAYPDTWSELNNKTYGIRLGSLVTLTAGSGSGKTQLIRELKAHYHDTTKFKFADISLEEDVGDSISGLMSIKLRKRLALPDVEVSEDEEREAFDYYFKDHRWSFYDHFGGMDDNNLFGTIRYLASTGHKIIYLDHLSIIVSEYAASGGERERIDTIMTKLAKLVKELNICIFLIVHLRKTSDGKSFEQGTTPTLDDLRGSGSLKQLSWDVISLTRNQQHPDPYLRNVSMLDVLKCRFTGRTGPADYLHFQESTGRMVKVPKPENWD